MNDRDTITAMLDRAGIQWKYIADGNGVDIIDTDLWLSWFFNNEGQLTVIDTAE